MVGRQSHLSRRAPISFAPAMEPGTNSGQKIDMAVKMQRRAQWVREVHASILGQVSSVIHVTHRGWYPNQTVLFPV